MTTKSQSDLQITANPIVSAWIRERGPIPAARVSSAQARGRAKRYPYWGTARYQIELSISDDRVVVRCCCRAHSDRRVRRLAELDATALAERLCGVVIAQTAGVLSDEETIQIVEWIRARAST